MIKLYPGHSLFRLDIMSGEITLIKPENVKLEKGILYTSALNMKNAKRRFEKMVDYLITNN